MLFSMFRNWDAICRHNTISIKWSPSKARYLVALIERYFVISIIIFSSCCRTNSVQRVCMMQWNLPNLIHALHVLNLIEWNLLSVYAVAKAKCLIFLYWSFIDCTLWIFQAIYNSWQTSIQKFSNHNYSVENTVAVRISTAICRQPVRNQNLTDASFITANVIHGLAPCTFEAQTNRREISTKYRKHKPGKTDATAQTASPSK